MTKQDNKILGISQTIDALTEQRRRWEEGTYAASNKELYALLGNTLDLFIKVRADVGLAKAVSSLMDTYKLELRPRFRTISLLTLCCHFPSHISKSLYRCLVADAGMPTLPVVENLDVFKDSNLGLRARFKALAVHQFFFQRSKEALHRRVI